MHCTIADQQRLLSWLHPLLINNHAPSCLSPWLASNHNVVPWLCPLLFCNCQPPWLSPLRANNHQPSWLSALLANDQSFHCCIHWWPATTNLMAVSIAGQQPPMVVTIAGQSLVIPLVNHPLVARNHQPPCLSALLASDH